MDKREAFHQRARTKIVATLGPASASLDKIGELMQAGVDVFRINMAHGSRADHQRLLDHVRQVSQAQGTPVGVLIDLAGPKIRLGRLLEDPTHCQEGERFTFVRGEASQDAHELVSNYERLVDELEVGDKVMLADGAVSMVVVAKDARGAHAQVRNGGQFASRQGINLPGVKLSIPALSDKDLDNAAWAAQAGVDFVGLSFVRTANEVHQLEALLRRHGSQARIIAKIEKPEALQNLDAIIEAAGGAMVARGDLGVEIDIAEIAVAQKSIIRACARFGKPVIVATQMLDSMQRSRRPTRAEATDVANAILDGADACMLSGETAVGDFPREAVQMMNRIMQSTEGLLRDGVEPTPPSPTEGIDPITSAVVYGAGRVAVQLDAGLIVVATRSGATALLRSKTRDFVPTVAVSDSERALQQCCLFWGVTPLRDAPVNDPHALRSFIDAWGAAENCLTQDEAVVFIAGTGMEAGAYNSVVVHKVQLET